LIRADARSRITAKDVELVGSSLGAATQPASFDDVLDRPEMPRFLLGARLPGPSPSLLFYVLVRHALLEVGIPNPTVADYFAAVLREFGDRGRSSRIADVDDQDHHYLVDILTDLSSASGDRQFKVSVHLGNYALWLSGIFPERIAAQQIRRGGPGLSYYESLGCRGYAEASEHHLAERIGLEEILRTAAERAHEIRVALNRVSDQLILRSRLAA
jgi:hypothetical protein